MKAFFKVASMFCVAAVSLTSTTLLAATPQLTCTPDGDSEVEFSAQATVVSEDSVRDLSVKYAGAVYAQAGLSAGKLAQDGDMAGMTVFVLTADGGMSLGLAVPKGFSRMTQAFSGFFVMVGGGSDGASPVKCSITDLN